MIKIETPEGYFDLSPNTQFTYVIENAFFEEDEDFSAPLSLPFTLPNTQKNARLLGYADNLQVSFYPTTVPIIIYIEGALFFRGQLNVWRPGNKGYQVSVGFNKKEIDTSKSIREFEYGGVRTGVTDKIIRDADLYKVYPDIDYNWPQFWNVSPELNDRFAGSRLEINYWGGTANAFDNKEIAIPMPYLRYVLEQLFSELNGIKIEGSWLESIKQYIIYNPIVVNTMEDYKLKLYFLTDPSRLQYDTQALEMEIGIDDADTFFNVAVGDYIPIPNIYKATYSSGAWSFSPSPFTYTVTPPDVGNPGILLDNIFTYMDSLYGPITQTERDYSSASNKRMVIKHWSTLNNRGRTVQANKVFATYKTFGNLTYNDIEIANHLPDISVSDFINALKDGFNLSMNFNPALNKLTITPRKDLLLNNEVKNYTAKTLKDYEKEVNLTKNYRFVWVNDEADEETADRLNFRWHANNHPESAYIGTEELPLALATTKNELQDNTGGGQIEMPKVSQKMGAYGDDDLVAFTFRLLKWQGVTPDNFGGMLPLANDEDLTPNAMFNLWFKDWYRVTKLGRDYVNFRMNLSLQDILHFEPQKKWRVMHNNYIWKKIEIPITMKGLQVANVQLMRINNIANIFSDSTEGDVIEGE